MSVCLPEESFATDQLTAFRGEPGFVDLTVVELGPNRAYLDPLTGTGLLVLSPRRADWPAALDQLDHLGWLLLDEDDAVDVAGRTRDGQVAVCLIADDPVLDEPDIATIRSTLAALRYAAGLEGN